MVDLTEISDSTVKSALQALQDNNKSEWYTHFGDNVTFADDGNQKDFKPFFDNAFNLEERFLTIDKVTNQGKSIVGDFYAGKWGTFKVYFNFEIEHEKITRLDIGQVSKLKN